MTALAYNTNLQIVFFLGADKLLGVQRDELGDTQTGGKKRFQDCPVPYTFRCLNIGRQQQLLDLFQGQKLDLFFAFNVLGQGYFVRRQRNYVFGRKIAQKAA